MPSQQNLNAENRRMREQLAETVNTLEATEAELAAMVDHLGATKLELTEATDKPKAAKEKLKKQKELATKHNEWNDVCSRFVLCLRPFHRESHRHSANYLGRTDDRIRRCGIHFLPAAICTFRSSDPRA